jgi:hypothetical protein
LKIKVGGLLVLHKLQTSLVILSFVTCFRAPVYAQSPDSASANPSSEEVKTEQPAGEAKRLFGVIPNYRTVDASIPFEPLPAKRKLNIARHDSFDWPSYVFAAGLAFVMPGSKDDSYGTGFTGYANRYVRSASDQIVGNMLSEGFVPALLHQDPRYFRQGENRNFWPRLGSALSQIAVARSDSGHRMFNAGEFLGNAMAVGISNTYSPNLNSWSARSDKLAVMVSTDAFSNVMKEFGPDLKQKLLHFRHKSS